MMRVSKYSYFSGAYLVCAGAMTIVEVNYWAFPALGLALALLFFDCFTLKKYMKIKLVLFIFVLIAMLVGLFTGTWFTLLKQPVSLVDFVNYALAVLLLVLFFLRNKRAREEEATRPVEPSNFLKVNRFSNCVIALIIMPVWFLGLYVAGWPAFGIILALIVGYLVLVFGYDYYLIKHRGSLPH